MNMLLKTVVAGAAVALAAMAAACNADSATLVGDTIHAYVVYSVGSFVDDLGTVTAPGGELFGVVRLPCCYAGSLQVTGDQLTVTAGPAGIIWLPAAFDGMQFVDESGGPTITGLTLDAASTANGVGSAIPSWTAHSFAVNFQGEAWGEGQTAVFDIRFGGVPEPATWVGLIVGVAMIGFAARRRRAGMAFAV